MPLVTITVQKPKTPQFKDSVLSAVHEALVASGVPETDRFHRVLELEPEDFRFDLNYPDLTRPRNDDFVLIEILLSVGRSVKVKKKIVQDIISKLSSQGFDAERIMICFKETAWENWSFGGGRFFYM
ncbi:tautomerase family protein [Noviherbaspirillum massiliense]|uniref:tautomerase family protein n=1 Tax=Noviherbaspirillum massiliense TaxID=1465823 RepID=UPI00037CBA6B|nr:tautomerase family protein [Noviherbaspirillum massiliense]